VNKFRHELDAV
jgi:hypothetical protein